MSPLLPIHLSLLAPGAAGCHVQAMQLTLEVPDTIHQAMRIPEPERQSRLLLELACALYEREIKDWNGQIVDHGRTWETSGRVGKSPVILIGEKARKLGSRLKKFFAHQNTKLLWWITVLF